jgi:hypothetical protein
VQYVFTCYDGLFKNYCYHFAHSSGIWLVGYLSEHIASEKQNSMDLHVGFSIDYVWWLEIKQMDWRAPSRSVQSDAKRD